MTTPEDIAAADERRRKAIKASKRGGTASFKLNPDRFELIIKLIKAGNYAKVAAASVGITQNTYGNYLRRGRDVEAKLVEAYGAEQDYDDDDQVPPMGVAHKLEPNDWTCYRFWCAIQKADGHAEAHLTTTVRAAVEKKPEIGIQILERRWPARWKRRDQHEITLGDAAVDADQDLLAPAASELVHQALRAAAAAGELVEGTAVELGADADQG